MEYSTKEFTSMCLTSTDTNLPIKEFTKEGENENE